MIVDGTLQAVHRHLWDGKKECYFIRVGPVMGVHMAQTVILYWTAKGTEPCGSVQSQTVLPTLLGIPQAVTEDLDWEQKLQDAANMAETIYQPDSFFSPPPPCLFSVLLSAAGCNSLLKVPCNCSRWVEPTVSSHPKQGEKKAVFPYCSLLKRHPKTLPAFPKREPLG